MELIVALAIGLLTACGIYLLLRAHIFSLVFGLTLLSYAVNLFLFAMGRLSINAAPLLDGSERYADPLPQALVLTAIVIGFAMTAFVVVLALRARGEWGDDTVDPDEVDSSEVNPSAADPSEQTARSNDSPVHGAGG